MNSAATSFLFQEIKAKKDTSAIGKIRFVTKERLKDTLSWSMAFGKQHLKAMKDYNSFLITFLQHYLQIISPFYQLPTGLAWRRLNFFTENHITLHNKKFFKLHLSCVYRISALCELLIQQMQLLIPVVLLLPKEKIKNEYIEILKNKSPQEFITNGSLYYFTFLRWLKKYMRNAGHFNLLSCSFLSPFTTYHSCHLA